jgi:hypothetical protein
VTIVFAHSSVRVSLSNCNFATGSLFSTRKTNAGMDSTTKQATVSKQLDIFLKENVFFTASGVTLRLFLAIVNNL